MTDRRILAALLCLCRCCREKLREIALKRSPAAGLKEKSDGRETD